MPGKKPIADKKPESKVVVRGYKRAPGGGAEEYRMECPGPGAGATHSVMKWVDSIKRIGENVGRQKVVTFLSLTKAENWGSGVKARIDMRFARSTSNQSPDRLLHSNDARSRIWSGPADDALKYRDIARAIKSRLYPKGSGEHVRLPLLSYVDLYCDAKGAEHLMMSAPNVKYDLRQYFNELKCENPKEYAEQLGIALGGRHSAGYIVAEYHESLSDIHDIEADGLKWPVIIDVGNLVKGKFGRYTYSDMANELTECLQYLPKEVHSPFFKWYFKMVPEHKESLLERIRAANETKDPPQVYNFNPESGVEFEPTGDDLTNVRHELNQLKKSGKFGPLERLIKAARKRK